MPEQVQLVPLDRLQPALYNPREADQTRLGLLKLSLAKLGFVLPLYATPDGHLLSGHQRLHTATELGCKQVPVVFMDVPDKRRKQMNLSFNRATNDMRSGDNSENLLERFSMSELQELLDRVPDKDPNSPEFFPCMRAEAVPYTDVIPMIDRVYETGAVGICSRLLRDGEVAMPLVVNRATRKIVNGNYRAIAVGEYMAKLSKARRAELESYPVVWISEDEARVAEILLNMISMRFTVEKQYSDVLRWGSYRRPNNKVEDLQPAYRIWADGGKHKPAHASLKEPERFWRNFRKEYGEAVCDFGAGQRRTRPLLEQKGIRCVDWEPYPCDWRGETGEPAHEPSLTLARKVSDEFLAAIRDPHLHFGSVGLIAVLNSVPFHFDRMCVLACAHALSSFGTKVIGQCRSAQDFNPEKTQTSRVAQDGRIKIAPSVFELTYEKNTMIGDINRAPKVQKFHTPAEIEAMLKVFFEDTYIVSSGQLIWFRATSPKRLNPKVLKQALMHEFNLPYPDGQSIGRGEAAVEAFSQRLGVDLSKY